MRALPANLYPIWLYSGSPPAACVGWEVLSLGAGWFGMLCRNNVASLHSSHNQTCRSRDLSLVRHLRLGRSSIGSRWLRKSYARGIDDVRFPDCNCDLRCDDCTDSISCAFRGRAARRSLKTSFAQGRLSLRPLVYLGFVGATARFGCLDRISLLILSGL